jgi:hypothetical protein
MVFLGQGQEYAPTRDKPFEEWYKLSDCTEGSVERCTYRIQRCIDNRTSKIGHDQHTGLCLGGVTGNMANELFALYLDTFVGFMAQDGKKIVPPILLQQSGPPDGTDKLVVNAQQDEFCQHSCKDCKMIKYPEAIHNLAKETDAVLFPWWGEVDKFYDEHKDTLPEQEDMPSKYKAQGGKCDEDLDCQSRICDATYYFDLFGGVCVDRRGDPARFSCDPEPYDCYSCGWGYPCGHGFEVQAYEYESCWWSWWSQKCSTETWYHCVGLPDCFHVDDNGECVAR